jgi:predicted transcriptional regulator
MTDTKESELDSVLEVIENPVRRRIMKRLSEEPSYGLQLSKELGLGQALVAKHLSIMEKAGIVTSAEEDSLSGGRPRKKYSLAMSVSITMDVAPHLFKERAISFSAPEKPRAREGKTPLGSRVAEALAAPDDREKLSAISKVLGEVDARIDAVEEERVGLLSTRNELMNAAAKIVAGMRDLDTRRVLFHILEEHDRQVQSISESLDMREMLVKSILDELERDFFG